MSRRTTLMAAGLLAFSPSFGAGSSNAGRRNPNAGPLTGVTIEAIAHEAADDVPGESISLKRITLEPGITIPPHAHSGPVVLVVESGVLGAELLEGRGVVTTAPTGGASAPPIELMPGDNIAVSSGDSLRFDRSIQALRNDGDDVLVLLVSGLEDIVAADVDLVD